MPRTAIDVHRAVYAGDDSGDDVGLARFERDFPIPYVRPRSRRPGYTGSIVKAGAAIVGRSAGKVRSPLSALTPDETEELRALIARLGEP